MEYIPAPDVVQAEMLYVYDSQVCENVLHFQSTVGVTPTTMTNLGAYLVAWWIANIRAKVPPTVSLIAVKLTDLTTQMGPVINYATGLPSAGSNAGVALPNNVALVLTKRTILRGRSYRGRIYHMGLTEQEVTNNAVLGANVTALLTAYGLLLNFTATGTTWDMVVVSRMNGGAWRTTADSNQVISLDSDGSVDTQRRRLPRRS